MNNFDANFLLTLKTPQAYYDEAQTYKKINDWDNYFVALVLADNYGHKIANLEMQQNYYTKLVLKQDHEKTYPYYNATRGYAGAATYLGYMFSNGINVTKNLTTASKMYSSCVSRGNTDAMVGLATILLDVNNDDRDPVQGMKYLYNAYRAENVNAYYHCANAYQYEGFGDKYPDFTYSHMIQIYYKEVNAGNTDAMCDLGKILDKKGEREMALRLYKRAGDDGDKYGYALYALSIETKKPDKAFDYYVKGIEHRHAKIWMCDLVKNVARLEGKFFDYCVETANHELLKLYKDKYDVDDARIDLHLKQKECDKLKKEINDLTIRNTKLSEENNILLKDNLGLRTENAFLTNQKNALIKQNRKLQNAQLEIILKQLK